MKKYILAGLIGFGISAACLLPPILHFILGPLGPFIGGFVGGFKSRADGKGACIVGFTMGLCVTLFLGGLFATLVGLQVSVPGIGSTLQDDSLPIIPILIGVFLVETIMGTLSAYAGGKVANKAAE